MRFQRLDLERFGHFRGPKLTFERAPSLLLVHGSNEAGKTTLLQAIRWLLFGGSGWALDDAPPAVAARVELSNGTAIEIRRTKGRGGGLRGSTTAGDIDEEWILARLTRPNRVVFENVFGFSLGSLAEGAKALEHANLRNVIYGGGLGGMVQPDAILKDLKSEASELFAPAAKSQKKIATRIKRIDELRAQIKALSMRTEEWQHLEDSVDERASAAKKVADEWRARAAEAARLKAAIDAVEPLERLDRALAERAALSVVAALPVDAATKHATWVSQEESHARALDELDEAIAALDDTLAAIVVDERTLAAGDEIAAIVRDLPRFIDDCEQRPRRAEELVSLERRAADALRTLRPSWDLDRLRAFELDVIVARDFADACEELERIREQLAALSTALRRLDDDLRDNDAERALLPPAADVVALRAWLENAGEMAAERKALTALDARIATLKKQRELAKLDPQPPEGMRAPRAEVVATFETERDALDDERHRADEQVRTRRSELEALSEDDEPGGARVATDEELAAARQHRDELLDALLDGEATAARIRAHARAVTAADAMADEMRARAEVVQRRALLADARKRAAKALERAMKNARALDEKEQDYERRWRALWSIEPRSPKVMRTWLERRDDLRTLDGELTAEVARRQTIVDRIDAWTKRGVELVGDASAAELRARAAERVAIEDARVAELHALDKARARDAARRASTLQDLDAAAAHEAAVLARLPALLAKLGLERNLSPQSARILIEGLSRARTELVSGETALRAQLQRIDESMARYRERAESLLHTLDERGPLDVVVPSLERRLAAARDAARTTREAKRRRAEHMAKRERSRTARDEARANIGSLYAAADVTNDAELRAAIAAHERHAALTREIDADERLLLTLRGPDERDAFLQRVRTADAATLPALDAEVRRLEQEMLEQQRAVGDARARFGAIDGRGDAALALAELEAERAALQQEVERYAILTLSDALLTQAIERFERDNQPALLKRASAVFAAMTAGRYTAIRKSGDELVVERESVDEVSPEVLSTGTREQLYLAIRLAYVEHYCASAEPLPVVLDDVLVNFDDDRARATLEALAAFSLTTQVILFTCHASTRALAASIGAQTLEIPQS